MELPSLEVFKNGCGTQCHSLNKVVVGDRLDLISKVFSNLVNSPIL